MYRPLYYRSLERYQTLALKESSGDFDTGMCLSSQAHKELSWWESNVDSSYSTLTHGDPSIFIDTDSSSLGWGAFNKSTGEKTGGEWLPTERSKHINFLELKAVFFALKSFCSHMQDTHIRFQIDNVTAVAYIREMGGSKSIDCNSITQEIWQYAKERNIWISSAHIPGKLNVVADAESRKFDTEL